jgi:hypothetical protein
LFALRGVTGLLTLLCGRRSSQKVSKQRVRPAVSPTSDEAPLPTNLAADLYYTGQHSLSTENMGQRKDFARNAMIAH